jgi:hypothetical protein
MCSTQRGGRWELPSNASISQSITKGLGVSKNRNKELAKKLLLSQTKTSSTLKNLKKSVFGEGEMMKKYKAIKAAYSNKNMGALQTIQNELLAKRDTLPAHNKNYTKYNELLNYTDILLRGNTTSNIQFNQYHEIGRLMKQNVNAMKSYGPSSRKNRKTRKNRR